MFSNNGHDDLTYSAADRYLGGQKRAPAKTDLIQIIVSFNKRDFDALGATDEERAEGMRETTREGMEVFFEALCAEHSKLKGHKYYPSRRNSQLEEKWVAGIHLNTKKPHVHIIFHREVCEKSELGKPDRLHKIGIVPKSLLPPSRQRRNKEVPQDELGKIGRGFAAALDRAQEHARKRLLQRSVLGMEQSSSFNDFIFETPLVDRGVEHSSIETYLLSNMLSGRDYDLRRRIAASSPDEARRIRVRLNQLRQEVTEEERREIINAFPDDIRPLAARANVRADWPRIQAGVLWTAVRHAFGPRTAAYKRLLSINEKDLPDVTGNNLVGRFLMRIRGAGNRRHEEAKQREEVRLIIPKSFLDRLSSGTRAWLTSEVIPEIERSIGAGKTQHEIFAEIDGQIFSRPLPADESERDKEMAERGLIDAELKARIPKTFLDRLSDETRSWLTSEVMPEIERSLDVGETQGEIFAKINRRISKRSLPADNDGREKEMAERDIIDAVLKARVYRNLYSDDRLLELARRNTSLDGRDRTIEILLRGPAPEPGSPPDMLNNAREAFREPQIYETYYASPPARSDELRHVSPNLASLYDDGAQVKENIVIFPAEPHQLNPLIDDRNPFMTERRYAHQVIKKNTQKADEFYDLGVKIAGKAATPKGLLGVFRHFYSQLKVSDDGRKLNYKDKGAREQALDRTLEEMRYWAGEMEGFEKLVAVEPEAMSVEGMSEAELYRLAGAEWRGAGGTGFGDQLDNEASLFDQEVAKYSRMAMALPKGLDLAAGAVEETSGGFEKDEGSVAEFEDSDPQAKDHGDEGDELEGGAEQGRHGEEEDRYDAGGGAYVFNTAFRTQNLRDESLCFPSGLHFKVRERLVGIHMPKLDAEIEAGKRLEVILDDITRDHNYKIGEFLKAYVEARFRDPETRELNTSEAFRDAHARILAACTPEELMREASSARQSSAFNERQRRLLFNGRSPDHHTPQMREIRMAGWMTVDERVKALSEGRLPMSYELKKLLAEFYSRNSEGQREYFVQAIKTRDLRKPEESIRLGIWEMRERLAEHELQYLLEVTWREKKFFRSRNSPPPETASSLKDFRPDASPVSKDNEAVRIYRGAVVDLERKLIEELIDTLGEGEITQVHLQGVRERAANLAFSDKALVPDDLFDGPLEGAKKRFSDAVYYAQEKLGPRLRAAQQSLRDFYGEKLRKFGVSYPTQPAHVEELTQLGEEDRLRMRALTSYMGELKKEWVEVFERINESRLEILNGRGPEGIEKVASVSVDAEATAVNSDPAGHAPDLAALDADGTAASPTTPLTDSYSEYLGHLGEIEKRLIYEALKGQDGAGGEGKKPEQLEWLIPLEKRREIRDRASNESLSRLGGLDSEDALSVEERLSLKESLGRVVERSKQARSRVREAAFLLDRFIDEEVGPHIGREQLSKMRVGGGLYYSTIPKEAMGTLNPEKQERFGVLRDNLTQSLAEFRNEVRWIGKVRASGGFGAGAVKDNSPQHSGGSLMHDRLALGKEMILEVLQKCRRLDYARALDNGDTVPFSLQDERARMNPRQDKGFQSPKLEEHAGKLDERVTKLESRYQQTVEAHRRVQDRAREVIESYRKSGNEPPAMFVKHEDLAMAQEEAITHWLPDYARWLEEERHRLVNEQGLVRTEKETPRLGALLFLAQTEFEARKERVKRFDQTCHHWEWQTADGRTVTLGQIDVRIEQLNNNRPLIETLDAALTESGRLPGAESLRGTAAEEMLHLMELRQDLVRKIDSKQMEMNEGVGAVGEVIGMLENAYGYEAARRKQMPEPEFKLEELKCAARNIEWAGLSDYLPKLSAYERRHNEHADHEQKLDAAWGWGLSQGRLAVGAIELWESEKRQLDFDDAFGKHREDYRIPIRTDSGDLITLSLRDVRSESSVDLGAASPEERELQECVRAACHDHKRFLMAEVADANKYLKASAQVAIAQAVEWRDKARSSGIEAPGPAVTLTSWGKYRVERYAVGLPESREEEKERLLSWVSGGAVGRVDPKFYVDAAHSPSSPQSNLVLLEPRTERRDAHGASHGR